MSAMSSAALQAMELLKRGDASAALEVASGACKANARDAKAHLAAGIALRMLGRIDEAQRALERAAALDPLDFAPLHELALVYEAKGEHDRSLRAFERAAGLRPAFAAAHFGVGLGRYRRGDWRAAIAAFEKVLAIDPRNMEAMVNLGNAYGSSGDFARAGDMLARAVSLNPADVASALSQAHADLVAGNLARGWAAYSHRHTRKEYEAYAAQRGVPYRVPTLDAIRGTAVTLIGEQGLGDLLFFLRWAAPLRQHASSLSFAGDARLHSILARTGLFARLEPSEPVPTKGVLVGDLPIVMPEAPHPASLRVDPEPARLAQWRSRLEALGPPPYIGITWRAGEARGVYFKTVPLEQLFAALAPLTGTVIAIQRAPAADELRTAAAAIGRAMHDLSGANDDLEDALALVALLDRHIGVSNTNMHLAALAGKTADVLVPFPPEWRWQLGESSAWFPGFRIHRQAVNGDWASALAALAATGTGGNTSRG